MGQAGSECKGSNGYNEDLHLKMKRDVLLMPTQVIFAEFNNLISLNEEFQSPLMPFPK